MDKAGQSREEDEVERLREELEKVQGQLRRANADFEEFVSMAAHNLREPLRDVASFGQLLTETYADRLDAEAGVFLDHIQQGAAKMQSLLADVVDYWAAGIGDRQLSRTDMETVLCQALLAMDAQISARGAIVTHDPLPRVYGDFEMLTKVLRHLIRNAIEYGGTPSPTIHISSHISSRRENLEWVFSVKDNGPGIDPAFQNRVFGVFKRLHGREYPGNGLGLAFCKKAIAWQGGRIWLESAPGAGSTFYFTLPPSD